MRLTTLACLFALHGTAIAADDLAAAFDAPPLAARTRCFWWWLNGNVDQAAITKDLEWMKAIGMGGGLIFDAGGGGRDAGPTPTGPLFGSPAWRELFVHAVREADRLGLELSLSPQSGWNLGGPEVTPEQAGKVIAWSELRLSGPREFADMLPAPKAKVFRDTVVLAYRLKSAAVKAVISADSAQPDHGADHAADGDAGTFWVSRGTQAGEGPSTDKPAWLQLTFPAPVAIAGVRIAGRPGHGPKDCAWQVQRDGAWSDCATATLADGKDGELRHATVTATTFRLLVRSAYDTKGPGSRNVQVIEMMPLGTDGRPLAMGGTTKPIRDLRNKAVFHELGGSAPDCRPLLNDIPATAGEEDAQPGEVLDLTAQRAADGTLRWSVPTGDWQVLRFGWTLNGGHVSTSSGAWKGLVVDYLDADALKAYWQRTVDPLLDAVGPLAGKTLTHLETDSWEGGGLNWSRTLPDAFRRLRGYDPMPWLPVIAGRIIGDRERSNRFLADLRKTIGELMAEQNYTALAELAARRGLGTHCEAGGPHAGPFDALANLGRQTMPMGEFWVPSPHRPTEDARFFMKTPASAAHLYGRRIACGEGFTSIGPHWGDVLWSAHKPTFDHEACAGLNLTYFHAFTCSPASAGLPGQEYFAGTHFNPQITWASMAQGFIGYLNRCQALLQRGLPVSDVLVYVGDHVPNIPGRKQKAPAGILPGHDFDWCNEEALLTRIQARDGRLVLPDGVSYRALVLPDHGVLSLPVARKLRELVRAGVAISGPRPVRTASLSGFPASEDELKTIADELWREGRKDGIVAGATAAELLAKRGVGPDVSWADARLDWIHRRDGDADIYFVCNQDAAPVTVAVAFRITGRQPELWDPLTGTRRDATAFTQRDGRTIVPLAFGAYGSTFVIFRRSIAADAQGAASSNAADLTPVADITGPWSVAFETARGGPAETRFETLGDWTAHADQAIRDYSGTATYRTTFTRPAGDGPWMLELGRVGEMARVAVNGQDLGVTWVPPYRVMLPADLKPTGNHLAIIVANTWWNRLLADQALPADQRLTRTNITLKKPGGKPLPSGLMGPVRILSLKR